MEELLGLGNSWIWLEWSLAKNKFSAKISSGGFSDPNSLVQMMFIEARIEIR